MIDLGTELAGYGDTGEPPRPARPAQPIPTPGPDGGAMIPLADLQAAGFNHEPPPDRLFGSSLISKMLLSDALFDDLFAEPVEPPDCLKRGPIQQTPPRPWRAGGPAGPAIGIEPSFVGLDRENLPPWLKLHTDEGEGDA